MLKDIGFSLGQRFSTTEKDNPMSFHLDCLSNSIQLDLLLGYFSSSAISMLSLGFATFLYNGGKVRMAINHILSSSDREAFIKGTSGDIMEGIIDLSDIKGISEKLDAYDRHFFECIAWLIANKKIEFVIIQPKEGNGIAHYKEGIYYDENDQVGFNGSMNFTANGLAGNLESLECLCSWLNGDNEKLKIKKKFIDNILEERDNKIDYLDVSQVIENINDEFGGKDLRELLEVEKELLKAKREALSKNEKLTQKIQNLEEIIEYYDNMPRFPYPSGPRDYQIEAYNKWVENGKQGLFAMATGTGKTLTAAYCLIEEFKERNLQKNIIVVPGIELINQWYDELELCNFKTIIKWASSNLKLKKDIDFIKILLHKKELAQLNIIVTYDSFVSTKFQSLFQDKLRDFVVVFDETHNMGAKGFMNKIKDVKFDRRIGLSATPLRLWDENNENQFIEDFFNTSPPYTYAYSMKDAIEKGFLCKYHYEPFFINFDDTEWEEYVKLTQQLHHKSENEIINTKAALKRQLLKDQAINKNEAVIDIITEIKKKGNYANTLVYCPKGIENDSDNRYIHILQDCIKQHFPEINTATFVGETDSRDLLLKDFEEESVHMLLAIKCLDEGVNIPKTMNAIFVASGQNYREFVQRRGRVLRNYKTDLFIKEYAEIFDIVVLPSLEQFNKDRTIAERLIISEFKRLYEFYNLASEKFNTYLKIKDELSKYKFTKEYIDSAIENKNY